MCFQPFISSFWAIAFRTPILFGVFLFYMIQLSSLFKERCLLSFGNNGDIGSHHSKKYSTLFGDGVSGIYFLQQVMVLFISKATFQSCASFFIQYCPHHFSLLQVLFFLSAFRYKVGNNIVGAAVSSVGIGGIYFIGTVMAAFAKELSCI